MRTSARLAKSSTTSFFVSRWARVNGRPALSAAKAIEAQVDASAAVALGTGGVAAGLQGRASGVRGQLDLSAASSFGERALTAAEAFAPFGSVITFVRAGICAYS